jgi:hypothetical protein
VNPIRQGANELVQRWADQGMIPFAHFMLADDVEWLIREEMRPLLAEAVDLIDVVDGSGGGMLYREPYKSIYAKLKDLGAAPSGGNHEKQGQPEADEPAVKALPEREPPAVRADAEPDADDGRG